METDGTSRTPLLDEWIAEVGEEAVVAIVRAGITDIENGAARDLIDEDAYAAWLTSRPQRSAS